MVCVFYFVHKGAIRRAETADCCQVARAGSEAWGAPCVLYEVIGGDANYEFVCCSIQT